MNDIIQIGLTASVEINYIKLLINSLILLADNPNNLEFIIGVDTGKGKGNVNLSDLMQHKIVKYDTKLPYSSMAHGLLMDYLLHNYFNKKFGMIIDSDVCFLRKGWDTDFISEITKSNLIYLGTENVNKDRKFPGPYCMFFQIKEMQNMNSMKPMDDTPMVVVEGISVAFMAIIIVAAALYIINLGVCIAACVKAGMMNNQSSKTLWICLLVFLGILPFGGGIGNLVIFVFACILISSFNGKKNRPNLQMTWNF